MGSLCTSCCGDRPEESNLMPSPETRRRQQAEAAERRRQENDRRGIRDPESVKRQQQRAEELERREQEAARSGIDGGPTLKQINAKSSRRKGMLRQPPDLEAWTGKWFPFDPTSTTTTTTTTTPKPTTIISTGISPKKSIEMDNSIDDWSGKWFPFEPNSVKINKVMPKCDDGKHSIAIDFDPTDRRHSFNYLCLTHNRTSFKPNMDLEAILTEQMIPPTYVPPVKCLNETISYDDPLPTFGAFRPLPPKYGTYRYLPPQRWLRSITEGAIVMLYHPCAYPAQVKLLQNTIKSCLYRHIITPNQNLSPDRPLALIAWGKSLKMSVLDERVVVNFIKSNAKLGPLSVDPVLESTDKYEIELQKEAKLITDIEDTEICGYKEM